MTDFLERMRRSSRERVQKARAGRPESALLRQAVEAPPSPKVSFSGEGFDLIGEVKFRSPSSGWLVDPERPGGVAERVGGYARGGALAASVLTEPAIFDGDLDHLRDAAKTGLPSMRKDFLVDPYQILEARAAGAAGVLLIVRMLDDVLLREMVVASREMGLFVLLESFDEDDLDRAVLAGGGADTWFGVNTRDLRTLSVDRRRLERLSSLLPEDRPCVAESGIATPEDAARAAGLRYSVALVGTALMRAPDPEPVARSLIAAGREAAGRGPRGAGVSGRHTAGRNGGAGT